MQEPQPFQVINDKAEGISDLSAKINSILEAFSKGEQEEEIYEPLFDRNIFVVKEKQ